MKLDSRQLTAIQELLTQYEEAGKLRKHLSETKYTAGLCLSSDEDYISVTVNRDIARSTLNAQMDDIVARLKGFGIEV